MAAALEDVYCTLLMSDSYLPGAAVLAHSLRDGRTTKKLAVLVTPDSLLYDTITELKKLYDYVLYAEKIANPNLENLVRLNRLDLRFAFTKINLWRQHQFRKIVYIDADVVALRAPDELFDIDAPLAAAPDIGWPDIFNSGVMMLKPNMGEYWSLQTLASSGTSFDGADQGLLNEHFANRSWHRLSFTYNCTPSSSYQYEPAYRHFRSGISLVHFIGSDKPWSQGRQALSSSGSGVYKELLGRWWATYDRHYRISQSSVSHILPRERQVVQQYVKGEESNAASAWAAEGLVPAQAAQAASTAARTVPMEEQKIEPAEIETSTMEQHNSSPPQMQWDATLSEPPVESRPEAKNFPTQHYEMSQDPGLFHPPSSYPEAPKGMYYKVPEIRPAPVNERPPAIFPWEQNQKKPTRVFPDDPQPGTGVSRDTTEGDAKTPSPSKPKTNAPPTNTFSSFNLTNAWDNNSSIDQYIRAMKEAQARRGHVQVLHQDSDADAITSPTRTSPAKRRESLILTDFPTDVERPSLPVTPAPVQKSTFWGGERNEEGELPSAEGVPEQAEWNPVERLEQLRRSSLIATDELSKTNRRDLPTRDLPTSSIIPETSPTESAGPPPPLLPSVLYKAAGNDLDNIVMPQGGSHTKPPELAPEALSISTAQASDTPKRRDMSSLDEYSIA